MKIDENTIIRCKSSIEVIECLNKLKDLGFETFYEESDYKLFIATTFNNMFTNFEAVEVGPKNNLILFKTFQKLYNKQIKEKKPNLLVDKNGKILKVNNINKKYDIFAHYSYDDCVKEYISDGDYIAMHLNTVDYYRSKEALEKALKRKEVENKLRALAFELNGNKDIDWNDDKLKNYLIYCSDDKTIVENSWKTIKNQGTIYCYSEDFKDKAIELIGEKALKDYLINC